MKTVNVTLILSLIAAGVLLVLAAVAFSGMLVLSALQGSVDLSRPAGEIGDVEGYALIIGGLGWAIAAFGSLLFGVFAILLAVCGFLLILFAVIARAVYAPQGGRLTAHRVLMAIVCLGMAAGDSRCCRPASTSRLFRRSCSASRTSRTRPCARFSRSRRASTACSFAARRSRRIRSRPPCEPPKTNSAPRSRQRARGALICL